MEGLSGYGNSQLFEEFGSAERDDVLIDMPEDSDASRFLYSVEPIAASRLWSRCSKIGAMVEGARPDR